MLKRSLSELATGAIFSSEKLTRCLRAYLRQPASPLDEKALPAECRKALVDDLDHSHPHRFRLNDLRRGLDVWWPERLFVDGRWPVFDELFAQLMLRNGDFIQYRDDQVQAYARLAADLDPTLLAAWHIAGWALHADVQPHDLARVVDCQLPFFAPPPRPNRQYAEGHVHLGGIHVDALALLGNLGAEMSAEFAGQFRHLRELMTILLDTDLQKDERGSAEGDTLRGRCPGALSDVELHDKVDRIDWAQQFEQHRLADDVGGAWMKAHVAHAMLAGDQGRAWRWLVVYLWYSYRHPASSEYLRVAIFYLFGSLMQFRRKMIMDGQGLTRFTQIYYGSEMRKKVDFNAKMNDVVARMFVGKNDLAEIKISPDAFESGLIAHVASAVAKNRGVTTPEFGTTLPAIAVRSYVEQLERWHFCAHFSRNEKYVKERRLLWQEADKFAQALSSESGWNLDAFLGGHLNPHYRFYPGRWLRGLDVAGDENLVRSEVFAPVLRWLRCGLLPRPPGEQGSAGFHLSVHAGEDYAHPLSGQRHVDETVRFCGMRSGDRIGHGLALGLEPAAWVKRHGDMILPVDEHLDNLVWAWHHACVMSSKLPLAAQIIPRLEQRIARFLPLVSWHREGGVATPQDLYSAWELRRNCYYQFLSYSGQVRDARLDTAVPDNKRLSAARRAAGNSPENMYVRYQEQKHTNMPGHWSELEEQPGAPDSVLIRQPADKEGVAERISNAQDSALHHDFETPEDLEFMCALQDYLLNKYDAMGLIIEANPTSNVYIARLENHSEHPIFRWYPPNESCLAAGSAWNRFGLRRGPIKVLVNTDDPGIMPTTLRTEFALLGEAALDLGYSRTCVESWQERLREFGLDEFNRNHLPVFEEKN